MYSDFSYCVKSEVCVQKLIQEFKSLENDALHEAKNVMGFFSSEYCNELSIKYQNGYKLCEKYLKGLICLKCLVKNLELINLGSFIYNITDLYSEDSDCVNSSEIDSQ